MLDRDATGSGKRLDLGACVALQQDPLDLLRPRDDERPRRMRAAGNVRGRAARRRAPRIAPRTRRKSPASFFPRTLLSQSIRVLAAHSVRSLGCRAVFYTPPGVGYDQSSLPMGRTLHRYVFLQVLGPFAAGLALFTFILLIARILKLIELVVNRGVPALQILALFSYILPAFLEVTVPMALLLACLLACGRLSADSEFTALKSSGLSLYQVAVPIGGFALIVYAASLWLSLFGSPAGNAALKAGLFELARTRASVGLKEHVFNDDFKDLVIYVEQITPPGTNLERILISDRRLAGEHNTVLARRGMLMANEDTQSVTLRLFDGVIYTDEAGVKGYHKTDFSTYDVSLNLAAALGQLEGRDRDPNELTLSELRAAIAEKQGAGDPALSEEVELHRRYSVPFACLVFAILGVPLGLQPVRAVRSRGLAVSLVIILSYYLMLSAAETLGERGRVPIALALWTPNLTLGLLGALLFVRDAHELSWSLDNRFRLGLGSLIGKLATRQQRTDP